jgi:hypothetical protein
MPRRRFPLSAALLLALSCSVASAAADAPATKNEPRDYTARILTPKAPATPRINGPTIYGQRPGRPFLYTIPATGDRPMKFAADNLPEGLNLNEKTGRITGKVEKEGEVRSHASRDQRQGQQREEVPHRHRRSDRPHSAARMELLELLGQGRRRRKSPRLRQGDGRQGPGQSRLDVHQHRRRLARQARRENSTASSPTRNSPT